MPWPLRVTQQFEKHSGKYRENGAGEDCDPLHDIIVDGVSYHTPYTFHGVAGSRHTVEAQSLQAGPPGTRFAFSNWNDGGAAQHVFTVPSSNTLLEARFRRQYSLGLASTPAAAGVFTATPASADAFYDAGTSVQVRADAASGYRFSNFSGNLSGAVNPQSLVIDAPKTVTANFIASGPAFSAIRVHAGGPMYTDPQGQDWSADYGFSGGAPYRVSTPIAHTATPFLYQSQRESASPFLYRFNVPDGSYVVRLKFAELREALPVKRNFLVDINGVTRVVDIVAAAGASRTAVDMLFDVDSRGGQITINFAPLPLSSGAAVSAIEIISSGAAVAISPSVTTLDSGQGAQLSAAVAGVADHTVTWSLSPNIGSVDSNGMYYAPAQLFSPTAVTVTATSVADPAKSASATVDLSPQWKITSVLAPGPTPPAYVPQSGGFVVPVPANGYDTQFVYRSMTGDGAIIARLAAAQGRTGIMMRQKPGNGSEYALLTVSPTGGSFFESRGAMPHYAQDPLNGNNTGAYWLRMVRTGDTFTALVSFDGMAWLTVSQVQIPMSGEIQVGLAVTGGQPGSTATFDSVRVAGNLAVFLYPGFVSLGAGQQTQFFVIETGLPVPGQPHAQWSTSPAGLGSISNDGFYTAPQNLTVPRTVTVTATSTIDASQTASTVVPLGSFAPIRLNAGGPSYVDPDGAFWTADASGADLCDTAAPLDDNSARFLYKSCAKNAQYLFYVPNGTYKVKLKFAEPWLLLTGQRIFDVSINTQQVLANFDILAESRVLGSATIDKVFTVDVNGGVLAISFNPRRGDAIVNAIEITQ